MSRELAAGKKAESGRDSLLESVAPVLATVQAEDWRDPETLAQTFANLKRSFDRDYKRVAEMDALLFGADITAYGERASAAFSDWEREGGGPSMPAMIVHAARHFGIDENSQMARAMMIAAVLAEAPNTLQYHGNEHYRKVLFHAIRLAATHNQLFTGTERALSHGQIAVLLTASCVHDLGHEGGDNQREGVYAPGAMEQRAIDISRPYLEATALDKDSLGEIETLIFCTDITFFAGDNSPCIRMKKIYKHFFWEDDSEDVSMMTMGKLRRFEDNPALVQMAMILHEADVGSSAGLSYEQTIQETINIMEERGLKTAGPATVLAFLREQLGETMFTEAGKQVFGPVMATVIKRAEKDAEDGRTSYYG